MQEARALLSERAPRGIWTEQQEQRPNHKHAFRIYFPPPKYLLNIGKPRAFCTVLRKFEACSASHIVQWVEENDYIFQLGRA
jgi:hypothetical protein